MEDARGIAELLPDFFRGYQGTVESIGITARANHQHARPPGDGMLSCVTVDVALRNHGLFGTTGPFLDEVFPRYRFLTTELAKYLADRGVSLGPERGLSVAFVPRPEHRGYVGNAVPKLDRPSRGVLAPQ